MAIYNVGSTGDDVTKLQTDLKAAGFDPGGIDGIYGPKTQSAVTSYQKANNLTVDGIAGPQTLGSLSTYLSQPKTGTSFGTEPDLGGLEAISTGGMTNELFAGAPKTINAPVVTENQDFGYSDDIMSSLASLQEMIASPPQYDYTQDPLYAPLRQQYMSAGKSAFNNTIGRLSALTGGRPSTAAVGTATAAQNQYANDFSSNVLPQLASQYYNRQNNNLRNRLNMLGIQTDMADTIYNRRMDADETAYNRGMEADEIAWRRSADNPAVRSQILNNAIKEFELQNLPEQYRLELERIKQNLASGRINTEIAREELNNLRSGLTRSGSVPYGMGGTTGGMNETGEVDTTPTPGQIANYNEILRGLLSPTNNMEGNPVEALRYIDRLGKDYYTKLIGEPLYNQLVNDLTAAVNAPPPEEPEAPSYKSMNLSEIREAADDLQDPTTIADLITSNLINAGYLPSVIDAELRRAGVEPIEKEVINDEGEKVIEITGWRFINQQTEE